jgi:hypothetical protein
MRELSQKRWKDLDELGDTVDGSISQSELREPIDRLN